VNRVREALRTSNIPEIRSAMDALNQLWQQAASKMYQQASAQTGSTGAGPSGSATEEKKVQDADYEVVDDNKS